MLIGELDFGSYERPDNCVFCRWYVSSETWAMVQMILKLR